MSGSDLNHMCDVSQINICSPDWAGLTVYEFKETISESRKDQTNFIKNDRKQLPGQIKEYEDKLSYLRDLLSSKQLDPADFREMKAEYTAKLRKAGI